VRWVRWSWALNVGVDDARRSSGRRSSRHLGPFSVCRSPLESRSVRQAGVPERANEIYDLRAVRLEMLQSEPSKVIQRRQKRRKLSPVVHGLVRPGDGGKAGTVRQISCTWTAACLGAPFPHLHKSALSEPAFNDARCFLVGKCESIFGWMLCSSSLIRP
jgi:hypothetical protein